MADDENQKKPLDGQPAPRELKPGLLVGSGRYLLKKFLGQGGMGVVWLAQDKRLGEDVALKFLPSELHIDSSALDDLRQETLKSRKLAHPNIIRIHDLFELESEYPFISMEYVDGPTLSKRRVQMPARIIEWDGLADMVRQLCEALEYAHNERVIHRDLKPANLMLDSRQRIKLADFGIARVVTDSLSRVTMRQGTSGTLVYMSPQQLDGRPSNPTDDIYSVGATVYELLTSKPPFYTGEIAHQIRYVEACSVTQRLAELRIASSVPKAVEDTVVACLKKNPSDRPQNARMLGESFGLLESKPASSKSTKRVAKPEAPPPPRKTKPPVTLALVILAELIVILGAMYYLGRNWFKPQSPRATTGSVQVTIMPPSAVPDGAAWQVDSGNPHASGELATNLSPGEHLIDFRGAPGWIAPQGKTVKVLANQMTAITETYQPFVRPTDSSAGSLKVTISPPAAAAAGARWQVDGGPYESSGVVLTNLSLGSHSIAYQTAPPWIPVNPAVTITVDRSTNSIIGKYQREDMGLTTTGSTIYPQPGRSWSNSLGMRFKPLGAGILLSVWDTRVSDYRAFVADAGYTENMKWTNSEFANIESNPVVFVTYEDARHFCAWLTTYEHAKGTLVNNQKYRLPTDREWSLAVGLTQEKGVTPKERREVNLAIYPWGTNWPPPTGAGNFAGKEVTLDDKKITDYVDSYPQLAPVGSFSPISGFYDLTGNVWQYCSDKYDPPGPEMVLRGGAWSTSSKYELRSYWRNSVEPLIPQRDVGFRCVLEP